MELYDLLCADSLRVSNLRVHEAAVRLGEELAAAHSNSTQVVKLLVALLVKTRGFTTGSTD